MKKKKNKQLKMKDVYSIYQGRDIVEYMKFSQLEETKNIVENYINFKFGNIQGCLFTSYLCIPSCEKKACVGIVGFIPPLVDTKLMYVRFETDEDLKYIRFFRANEKTDKREDMYKLSEDFDEIIIADTVVSKEEVIDEVVVDESGPIPDKV